MSRLFFLIAVLTALLTGAVSAQRGCRKVEFDGAVARGQEFRKPLSDALTFDLQPVADGWQIRVVAAGAQADHDAAEIATPPYQSINPLLLTTDYGFRAQDVVAWNPRQFQFVTDVAGIEGLSRDEDMVADKAAPPEKKSAAEKALIAAATHGAHGELKILEAALVPGSADQTPAAAAVASHWRTTPHTEVQPGKGKSATAQGEVELLKFRVTLWLPKSVALSREWRSAALVSCPQ